MRSEETGGSNLVTVEADKSKDKSNKNGFEISTTITVGDISDGEYEISVYLWDGLKTMIFFTV